MGMVAGVAMVAMAVVPVTESLFTLQTYAPHAGRFCASYNRPHEKILCSGRRGRFGLGERWRLVVGSA